MTTSSTFAIIGGGLAGAKAAEALRDKDFDGHVVLFGAEEHLPYERPPLSKEYLAGKKELGDFTANPSAWFRDHHIELQLGTEVQTIDPGAHTLSLPDGSIVRYDELLLGHRSQSRRPPIPGADAANVHYLRTIDDAETLKSSTRRGFVARSRRRRVDRAGGSCGRSRTRRDGHRRRGGRRAGFRPRSARNSVRCSPSCTATTVSTCDWAPRSTRSPPPAARPPDEIGDGTIVHADHVLVAVGASPNTALAEQAGLAMGDGGVLVDASLRTSDPDIFAVGDIAAAEHPLFGVRIRTEHWANALKQPAVAAASMLGKPGEYSELPYFFTDQYDLGMEYVGTRGLRPRRLAVTWTVASSPRSGSTARTGYSPG